MNYFTIMVSAILINNIVLVQFLGICPFLGVSNKLTTAVGMSFAVLFVMTLATLATYIIYYSILLPADLEYLQTVAFILVIASLVQLVEIVLKKTSPALHQALGVFLPLITTNCAILGVALLVIQREFSLMEGLVYAISSAIGFAIALIVFAGIRERLAVADVPQRLRGAPVSLITAGLLAMAFMGFAGLF